MTKEEIQKQYIREYAREMGITEAEAEHQLYKNTMDQTVKENSNHSKERK